MKQHLEKAIEAAIAAGREIMEVYREEDFQVEIKSDDSPLTLADKRANDTINEFLKPSGIPIISEENIEIPFEKRRGWEQCWIIDPLDGTKEFIKKNDEFTVNIALISDGRPELGVIYAPALNLLYFSIASEKKSFRATVNNESNLEDVINSAEEIQPGKNSGVIKVVGSRSHMNEETQLFIDELKEKYDRVEVVSKGSSLKFCLLAEGNAQYYPRFGPTMEWDTAAGQAICEAVGVTCVFNDSGESISYNRENLRNGNFSAAYEG